MDDGELRVREAMGNLTSDNRAARRAAVLAVERAVREATWSDTAAGAFLCDHVLRALLRVFGDSIGSCREKAYGAALTLLRTVPGACVPTCLPLLVPAVLQRVEHGSDADAEDARALLLALLTYAVDTARDAYAPHAHATCAQLGAVLARSEHAVAACTLLVALCAAVPAGVAPYTSNLLPRVGALLTHRRAATRKAALGALGRLMVTGGDNLTSHVLPLLAPLALDGNTALRAQAMHEAAAVAESLSRPRDVATLAHTLLPQGLADPASAVRHAARDACTRIGALLAAAPPAHVPDCEPAAVPMLRGEDADEPAYPIPPALVRVVTSEWRAVWGGVEEALGDVLHARRRLLAVRTAALMPALLAANVWSAARAAVHEHVHACAKDDDDVDVRAAAARVDLQDM